MCQLIKKTILNSYLLLGNYLPNLERYNEKVMDEKTNNEKNWCKRAVSHGTISIIVNIPSAIWTKIRKSVNSETFNIK